MPLNIHPLLCFVLLTLFLLFENVHLPFPFLPTWLACSDKDLLSQTRTLAMSFVKCASTDTEHQYKLVKDISFWRQALQLNAHLFMGFCMSRESRWAISVWKWTALLCASDTKTRSLRWRPSVWQAAVECLCCLFQSSLDNLWSFTQNMLKRIEKKVMTHAVTSLFKVKCLAGCAHTKGDGHFGSQFVPSVSFIAASLPFTEEIWIRVSRQPSFLMWQ